jgi:hypothetical protein
MDPVEQFITLDGCPMLGTDHKATVHCRSGGLRFSTPAGSRSMKDFDASRSPQSLDQVARLEHDWWSFAGQACISIPPAIGTENDGTLGHIIEDRCFPYHSVSQTANLFHCPNF